MTTKYPSLLDMGIKNPDEIARYSFQTLDNIDRLRVIYKRKQGSLLPSSKKFKFPRSKKTIVVDSGSNTTQTLNEISPFLQNVIAELDQVVNLKNSQAQQKEIILDEMQRLDDEVKSRMVYIKSLIEKLN